MTWTVAVLTVLTAFGGWLQVAGLWEKFGEWLDPIAVGREHFGLVEPTVTQDYVTSAIAVGLGLLGIGVAWYFYGARARPVPRWSGRPARRSSTSSGSTSSTTRSSTSRPSSSPASSGEASRSR